MRGMGLLEDYGYKYFKENLLQNTPNYSIWLNNSNRLMGLHSNLLT